MLLLVILNYWSFLVKCSLNTLIISIQQYKLYFISIFSECIFKNTTKQFKDRVQIFQVFAIRAAHYIISNSITKSCCIMDYFESAFVPSHNVEMFCSQPYQFVLSDTAHFFPISHRLSCDGSYFMRHSRMSSFYLVFQQVFSPSRPFRHSFPLFCLLTPTCLHCLL